MSERARKVATGDRKPVKMWAPKDKMEYRSKPGRISKKPQGQSGEQGGGNQGGHRDNARPNSPSPAGTKIPGF